MKRAPEDLSLDLEDALYIQNATFFALCAALEKKGAVNIEDVAESVCRLAGTSAPESARSKMLAAIAGHLMKTAAANACAAMEHANAPKVQPSLKLLQGGLEE